jgi:hypothetical protein
MEKKPEVTVPAQDADQNKPKKKPKKWCCLLFVAIVIFFSSYPSIRSLFMPLDDSVPPTDEGETEDKPEAIVETIGTPTAVTQKPDQSASTKPTTPATTAPDPSIRKAAIINFFVELANYLQDGTREMFVMRWTKPQVAVGVGEGTFDASLNACLDSYISDFNAESASIKLIHDNTVALGLPNVKIYYWTDAQVKERGGADSSYGFVEWLHNDDKSLSRSVMFLSDTIASLDQSIKCQVIRHEMTHAIGFWGHSDVFPASIMGLPKTIYSYPEEDKILIRMLYNSGLPIGSKEAETRAFFESNFNY